SRPRMRGWARSKSSKVIWSGGTAAYHSDVPVSRRSIRMPPFRCVTRITRSALSYSCRRIERRRFSFARPAFVTNPTTSRSPIVWRAARMDRWNSWWASRSSTSSSRYIVGRQARTTRPACVSSIFLCSMSNINVVIWWQVKARATCTRGRTSSRVSPARFPRATMPCGSTEFPAIEEDDLVAFHDRAHAEEGRQVEHEVGTAVDQGDLARVEGPEDPVQGGHGGREGGPRDRPEFRDRDHGGLDDERDGILPAIRWRWRYKVGGAGEG